MKKFYANNHLRKLLKKEEKNRYNAYKKRECERRRRYKRKGVYHQCYTHYRCEACKRFYQKEEYLFLLFGFTICVICVSSRRMESFFLKIKFDWTPHKEFLRDRISLCNSSLENKGNEDKTQFHIQKQRDEKHPFVKRYLLLLKDDNYKMKMVLADWKIHEDREDRLNWRRAYYNWSEKSIDYKCIIRNCHFCAWKIGLI